MAQTEHLRLCSLHKLHPAQDSPMLALLALRPAVADPWEPQGASARKAQVFTARVSRRLFTSLRLAIELQQACTGTTFAGA